MQRKYNDVPLVCGATPPMVIALIVRSIRSKVFSVGASIASICIFASEDEDTIFAVTEEVTWVSTWTSLSIGVWWIMLVNGVGTGKRVRSNDESRRASSVASREDEDSHEEPCYGRHRYDGVEWSLKAYMYLLETRRQSKFSVSFVPSECVRWRALEARFE